MAGDLSGAIVALIAVLTLPLGILTGLFVGLKAAAVVFVVGWFLLVPTVAIVGDELLPALGESVRDDSKSEAESTDPLTELKERYARGEIDEAEFERRIERLLEVEGVEIDRDVDLDSLERDENRDSLEGDVELDHE